MMLAPPSLLTAERLVGILVDVKSGDPEFIRFDSDSPGVLETRIAIQGAPGALDFHPASGELLGSTLIDAVPLPFHALRLFRIDPISGKSELIGTDFLEIEGVTTFSDLGMDFDPVDFQLRVVDPSGGNYRLDPSSAVLTPLTSLSPTYPMRAIALDNLGPTGSAAAYALDPVADTLLRIGGPDGDPSPDTGSTTVLGPLGVDLGDLISFDVSPSGAAYATALPGETRGPVPPNSHLYRIDLQSGAATDLGQIGPDPGSYILAMASVREPQLGSAVSIPALSRSGWAALALFLGAVAVLRLRQLRSARG